MSNKQRIMLVIILAVDFIFTCVFASNTFLKEECKQQESEHFNINIEGELL